MDTFDDRLIVALDLPNAETAVKLVDQIGCVSGFYKIGMGMISRDGFGLAAELKRRGKRTFLDMKLFDIGTVVANAVSGVLRHEPDLLTVHGDPHVVRAAAKARGDGPTRILAVTILTSLDRSDLDESLLRDGTVADIALERAERAFEAGADGVICSPREAAKIRSLDAGTGKLIVTPGVRPAGTGSNDQKRTATPAQAIASGADHIVVGRPITGANDPRKEVQKINRELSTAA